jgi:DNA-binding SARP family transcriptional activator/tetratricopeptide (TPR) repeat protein
MAEIRLLGPVEIVHGGGVLRLERRQQCVIIGALALEANRVISVESLIDLLWGDDRLPRDARAVTQTRVSELKAKVNALTGVDDDGRSSDAIRIVGRPNGYVLSAPPESIDVHRFLALLERVRSAEPGAVARGIAEQALALWRGPALGGGLIGAAYDRLCSGLESARLTVVETLYRMELLLGNHAAIVDKALHTALAHPTREGLMRLALQALDRAGRTGDALRAYDRWRRWLRDELGVDPGRDMQELYLSMLRNEVTVVGHGTAVAEFADRVLVDDDPVPPVDPAPVARPGMVAATAEEPKPEGVRAAWTPAVPRTLPPDTGDFTGRAREVEIARRVLTGSRTTAGVIALAGPGGVGKTALAVHLAHVLSAEFPDGQIMINLRGLDPNEPAPVADVLNRLLRSFGLDPDAIPHAVDDRLDLYRTLTADMRVLVILDNAASDEQVSPLVPSGRAGAAIITSRARLGGTLGARIEEVAALPPADAVALLAAIAGEERIRQEPAVAEDLCARCGHLPLAIRVVGARLQAKPHWTLASMITLLGDERRRLDHLSYGQLDLRASISLSYQALDTATQRLLRAIGDLGVADVTPWLAAALVDTSIADAAACLEQLFDVQLLDVVGGPGTGQVRYVVHEFVRLYAMERAADDDEPSRRCARTRAYRAWLTVADHAHAVLLGGDYRNVAGGSSRRPVDPDVLDAIGRELVSWFETERDGLAAIVRRAAADDAVRECWELASTTSPLFEICRYYDEWDAILEVGLAATRRTGDRLGEAALLYRSGCALADRVDNRGAWQCFQDAAKLFEAVGDEHGLATATLFTATIDRFQGDLDAALARYETALPVLRDSGDLGGEAQALRGVGQVYLDRRSYDAADAYLDRSIVLCQLAGWPLGEAQGLFWHGMLLVQTERFRDAELRFRAAQEICRTLGDRSGEAQTIRGQALCLRSRGNLTAARAALAEALVMVRQPRPTLLESHIRHALADLDADLVAGVNDPA